jgi:hypothetical protein
MSTSSPEPSGLVKIKQRFYDITENAAKRGLAAFGCNTLLKFQRETDAKYKPESSVG